MKYLTAAAVLVGSLVAQAQRPATLFEGARLLLPGLLVGVSPIARHVTMGAFVTASTFVAAGVFVGVHYGATPLWAPWLAVALAHGVTVLPSVPVHRVHLQPGAHPAQTVIADPP